MKNPILTAIAISVTITSTAFAQTATLEKNKLPVKIRGEAIDGKQPLVYLDGVKQESGALAMIDPNTIKSVSILKDSPATSQFGVEASNGVILIRTKDTSQSDSNFTAPIVTLPENYPQITINSSVKNGNISLTKLVKYATEISTNKPVYVLDGKIIENPEGTIIAAERVNSISILKGIDASKLYGETAAKGAVIISTKASGTPE
ncbi:TonB-dependent receptor plug domain-containing protein [Pedobacter sp. AW1-32]|uniref:TonB-dependent receptor plug domain-containing protein n=1 Tax=Pedobacter sp. AW1-32 TaxID=3383026 RepID=UPI003FEDAEF2